MSAGLDTSPLGFREDSNAIVTLTLNCPENRNPLSSLLMSSLQAALNDIAASDSTKLVIIAANGPAFCSGHDLHEIRANNNEAFYNSLFTQCSELMQMIVTLPQPVMARVQGIATAAGCQLVASCDLAVASTEASFATPGVNIGLFCSTPMVALARNIARKQAMEMLLLGESIDAQTAMSYGLINRAVDPDHLDTAIQEFAEKITGKSTRTVRIGKRAFYRQLELNLREAYEFTAAVMTRNMLDDDASEGINAFLEKRQPQWQDN